MRTKILALIGAAGLLAGLAVAANPGTTADHLDAPLVQLDHPADINDVYAFQSPTDPNNTVMVMTVNPAAGVISPTTFDRDVLYTIRIDNDGDALQDVAYKFRFGDPNSSGQQRYRFQDLDGNRVKGVTGTTTSLPGGDHMTAGLFDDPFFFDLAGFQNNFAFTGDDFFAGLNVSAIVLEVPSSALTNGTSKIGVWAETSRHPGKRIDRMGRPAINTVLIPSHRKDAFNMARPHNDDRRFTKPIMRSLRQLSALDGSGYSKAEALAIADLLTPDILTVDTANPGGFVPGLNGRQLADDVIDFELFIVTGGLASSGSPVLTTDGVDANDVPFSTSFPYLAPPH